MKKNIIIGLLAVTSVLSLTYGYYQKIRADQQEMRAKEEYQRAEMQKRIANESRKLADRTMEQFQEAKKRSEEFLFLAQKEAEKQKLKAEANLKQKRAK